MQERESRLPSETAPLRQGETLLFLSPYFLYLSGQTSGLEAVYNKFVAPGTTRAPIMLEGPMTPNQSSLLSQAHEILNRNEAASRLFQDVREKVEHEYFTTLNALASIVGADSIRLVTHERVTPDELRIFEPILRKLEADTGYPTFSFRSTAPGRYTVYPRDMATMYGSEIFLNPASLTGYQDENITRKQMLSEGGAVLSSGNVVLLSEWLRNVDPTAEQQKKLLNQMGYKVAWIPSCDPEKQPKGKKGFTVGHIDSHSALVQGTNGEQYLLVGLSYLNQSSPTKDKIVRAANHTGVHLIEIDDSSLPHLAFNFVQFRDGTIAISRTGRNDGSQYLSSVLEQTLEGIVGIDKVRLLPSLYHLPLRTSAGIRCMSNILPTEFIQKAKEATSQQ